MHEPSTFHNPILYRFIVAQGSYLNDKKQRIYFTPAIKGVSTSQHMSHSVIRLSCYLAVVCGVSLRHVAVLFAALFLIPITKSSIKRWMDDIGSNRSAATRQHYIQLYQAIKYLSLDIAEFIEKGPQITGPLRV